MLERTDEYRHFGNETAQAWQTKRSKTCNHIANAQERHYLHQAAHLAYVASVGTAIYHTNQGKEQCRHQAVREHLQHGTSHGCSVKHQDCKKHHTTVAHRRISVDILEVGLHTCTKSTVNDTDTSQCEEYPRKFVGCIRHQENGDAEATITTKLHKHASVEHRHSRRG